MATIKFPRKDFEKQIKITDEVIEKIGLFGIPIESITNDEIEIEVLPNRPDLLSIQGFIRAIRAYFGKETGIKSYKIKKPEKDYEVKISNAVKKVRPYTACAIVRNLPLDNGTIKEIIALQEKLHTTIGRKRKRVAIGIYPLDKIKFPIKYTALPPEKVRFVPLDFDREMDGNQILQKHPTGKEYAHLLENQEEYPVFIDSNNKILSMPPIINSNETGKITEQTKDVFIECSGTDFITLKKTLNIIITTLADMGADIYGVRLNYRKSEEITPNLKPEIIKISLENTNNLLGLDLRERDLERLLSVMCYNYKKGKVEIPAWRVDILHEVDIIEDIAIAYGYNNFIPEIPNVSTIASELIENKIKRKISEMLIGLGFIEISSYHFVKKDEIKKENNGEIIELENSKTEYKLLRSNLLIPLLRVLAGNKDANYPQKIFEIGTVFSKDKYNLTETGIKETENLIIASSPANFTEMKQILDYITKALNMQYVLKESINKELIEGRTALIHINNKSVGYMGDIHPKTIRDWNIKMPVAVLEISLDEIYKRFK